jgi:hypothetical protein
VYPPEAFVQSSWQGELSSRASSFRPYILDDSTVWNDPDFHALELPAVSGLASARGLARVYAGCVGAVDGFRILREETLSELTATRSSGHDLVAGVQDRFGAGFQLSCGSTPMSGASSFGHDGFGGCLAFGDRVRSFSFAMTARRAPSIGGYHFEAAATTAAIVAIIDGTR